MHDLHDFRRGSILTIAETHICRTAATGTAADVTATGTAADVTATGTAAARQCLDDQVSI